MLKTRAAVMWVLIAALLATLATLTLIEDPFSSARVPSGALEAGFRNPPDAARPRVWWHWMNGNVTMEGIRKDLEWMKRAGIGGFHHFDASLFTPLVVEKRLAFMTNEWKEAFKFTAELADKLGLEMAIAGSPGWSVSGGPWVPAQNGMKKYVWSETRITGGRMFTGKLPQPPRVTGAFQNVAFVDPLQHVRQEIRTPTYYADAAVVAFRQPERDIPFRNLNPKITASGGHFDIDDLTDGDLATTSPLPPTAVGANAWIQFAFDQPHTFEALTFAGDEPANPYIPVESNRNLEASDDGVNFRQIGPIPLTSMPQTTGTFAPATAKFFRITIKTLQPQPDPLLAVAGKPQVDRTPPSTGIAEIVLHKVPRVNRLEEKAGFIPTTELAQFHTPETSAAISPADVVDLTSRMKADGTLAWTPPAGNWVVVRMGYSLTGRQNHPASPEATGLEVDKLDAEAVKHYFEHYLEQYREATGGLMGKRGLQYVIIDSFEAGHSTWTKNMLAEFARRRGYQMQPWLPVLTGRIVKSTEASEQFLWDFRRTQAELMAGNHYDQLTDLLEKRGMGRYTESHELGRAYIADGMDVKRRARFPMAAMWTPGVQAVDQSVHQADIRESASVAHIYGQNVVAAESFTTLGDSFAYAPQRLKPIADFELASGVNRFVISVSVHQPLDDKKPGLGLGPFGQWFTRHETWAEAAKAWTDYLARSSYLLQQGIPVSDVAYFYAEDNNITSLFGKRPPTIPAGYNYDFINAGALIDVLSVKDGKLVTPSGMSYEVLVLDDSARKMSLPVLRKIRELARAGASISGVRPESSPSLGDDPAEFAALVKDVWGANNPNVSADQPLPQVLQAKKISPDFTYSKPQPDTEILFVHRRLADGEIYWVNNRKGRVEEIEATFRVEGKEAELWYPESGRTAAAGYRIVDGRTTVPLRLDPNEAVFVVFRKPATAQSRTLPRPVETAVATLNGAWDVSFQPDRGAPAKARFDALVSWSESADAGVKYFSGTAHYSRTFTAASDLFQAGARVWLDLGEVKELAEIAVNGKPLGVVWKRPFRVDVTEALQPGANAVDIRVTNLWVNRLIGDQQPNGGRKYTYTTMPFYTADSPLLPSGLLGPVRFVRVAAE